MKDLKVSSVANSADPTMEEILASIRKIISDEQESEQSSGKTATQHTASQSAVDDIFDLEEAKIEPVTLAHSSFMEDDGLEMMESEPTHKTVSVERLVSDEVEGHATSKLSQLSGMMVRGYPGSENTMEGMVRDMLRPMLKTWLDANLPTMVEQIVAREIARISGRAR